MKIMISSDLAHPYKGGGEHYVISVSKQFIKLGHEVHWLTSKIPNTSFEENFEGINIHRVPIFFPSKYFFPGRQSYVLTSLAPGIELAKKMDVVQTNTLVPAASGWIMGKYCGKPSVCFAHELFGKLWKKIGHNPMEEFFYPFMEQIIGHMPYDAFACPSQYSKLTLIRAGVPEDKITVIPHGIFLDRYSPQVSGVSLKRKLGLENKKTVSFLGRLRLSGTGQSKNLLMLLKAFQIVVKERPDARLVFGGSNFVELQNEINKLKLQNFVVYKGSVSYEEEAEFLAMSDVVVCPALSDGFCFLLEQAASSGKPIVATNAGSHPERIDGKNGILTDLTPESLADGIVKALDDEFAKKASIAARKHAENFTWEKSAKAHLKLYESLM